MRNRVLGCLGVAAVFLLIVSLVANLGFLLSGRGQTRAAAFARQPPKLSEVLVDAGEGQQDKKIVQIDLDGFISSIQSSGLFGGSFGISPEPVKRALRQAASDNRVAAIVLRINSPGGEVTASDVIYNAVAEASKSVPVVVHMDSLAASGGYYIACGANEIVASPTTITGSIGVIMQVPNVSELMGKVGVDMNTFRSGAFKDTGSMTRAMRAEERAYLQASIDETFDRFVGIVAAARDIPEDQLRNGGIADGRIFSGTAAAENGLVDQVGYIEDAYDRARALGGVEGAPVVRYQQVVTFANLLGISAEAAARRPEKIELEIGGGLVPNLNPGQVYLLAPSFVPSSAAQPDRLVQPW